MTSNGPLWEVTRDDETLLMSVYSSDIACDQMQRWIAWRGLVHPNVAPGRSIMPAGWSRESFSASLRRENLAGATR